MEKNVCIVHFNTPELTVAAVKSLLKRTPDCKVTVFDNSDKRPFPEMEGIRIVDNTKGQVIDFDSFLSRYPNKRKSANGWGSAKHSYTIQKLFDYFPEGFILMDSDVLVKRDISPLFRRDVLYSGKSHKAKKKERPFWIARLYPFICWINVPMCRKEGIDYFNGDYCWELNGNTKGSWYDTGAYFLEACRHSGLPVNDIEINDYILHLGSASFKNMPWKEWLEEHKDLYL